MYSKCELRMAKSGVAAIYIRARKVEPSEKGGRLDSTQSHMA